jgi:hypothetical protein
MPRSEPCHSTHLLEALACAKIIPMSETKDFGSFMKENKDLAKEYFDTKLDIYQLQATRILSKLSGSMMWIIVLLLLIFLFTTFLALVSGFWLTSITGSYISGFGLTTGFILLLTLLVTIFRRSLFINPIIRIIIKQTSNESKEHTQS